MAIQIITDSTSEITQQQAEELGIIVMPVTVHFGEDEFQDGINIGPEEFYERLEASDKLPTTSQISVQTFRELFESVLERGDEVVGIFMSSELSGTVQSAAVAREMIGSDRVYVVDGYTITFGLGALVHEAILMRDKGMRAMDIVAEVENLKQRIRLVAVTGTLEYLKRGGRLSSTSAFFANVLGIRPCIAVQRGVVEAIHKARGVLAGQQFVADTTVAEADFDYRIYLGHSAMPERSAKIRDMILEKRPGARFHDSVIGITVGTHVGPGCGGAAYFRKS